MGELIVTDAEIDGIPVAVIIDTGSQDCCAMPQRSAARFELLRSRKEREGQGC